MTAPGVKIWVAMTSIPCGVLRHNMRSVSRFDVVDLTVSPIIYCDMQRAFCNRHHQPRFLNHIAGIRAVISMSAKPHS
jgi:hypothetical protein